MGNNVPKIALKELHLVPANVLIDIHLSEHGKAHSKCKGDGGISWHNLLRGKVVMAGPSLKTPTGYPNVAGGGPSTATTETLKNGDQVWVRGNKGYPVEIEDGRKLFLFNEWDVAIKMRPIGASSKEAPPPYYPEEHFHYDEKHHGE